MFVFGEVALDTPTKNALRAQSFSAPLSAPAIPVGTASTTVLADNSARSRFTATNPSDTDIWLHPADSGAAVNTSPWFLRAYGGSVTEDYSGPLCAIHNNRSASAATTGATKTLVVVEF